MSNGDESNFDAFSLDKGAIAVRSLQEEVSEVAYWLSQPPARRIQAIEYLRESFHGHAYPAQRLERVFTVTQRK